MSAEATLVCAACGQRIDPRSQAPYRCPRAGDDRDHLLNVQLSADTAFEFAADAAQPFARYAELLYPFHAAKSAGWPAARYAKAVRRLDEQLEEVAGVGLRCTTPVRNDALSDALGCAAEGGVWVQNESDQPSGSHKARHLFGVALWLDIADALGLAGAGEPLAVASCGNAARAAAAIALAAGRELVVFVPDWASADTLAELRRLDADVVVCTRRADDPPGDPCVHHFHEALAEGALPFSCQGTENGLAVEGSRTIGWDAVIAEPHGFDRVQLQVGGGAFASGFAQGAEFAVSRGKWAALPRIYAVQSAAVAPLAPAWAVLAKWTSEGGLDAAVTRARGRRAAAMRPVEDPGTSVADGILDDETYDWLELARIGIASDGAAQVVSEELLRQAHQLGRDATGLEVCATGTAGLAGLLLDHQAGKLDPQERSLVVFTGAQR